GQRAAALHMVASDIETHELGTLRLALRRGLARQVLPALLQAQEQAEQQQRFRRSLKLQLLAAQAHYAVGQHREAFRRLEEVIRQAAPEGYLRLLLDEGATCAELLGAWWKNVGGEGAVRTLGLPVEYTMTLVGAAGVSLQPEAELSDAALTRKEKL